MPEPSAARIGVTPFWRWAVVPVHRGDIPGIGYWSRAAAEAFRREAMLAFPDNPPPALLRRRSWRTYDVVDDSERAS
jgi:hypothetical protein